MAGEFTIGGALPITGSSATIGQDQQRGAALAVKEINHGAGVLGKKLKFAVEDTEGTTVSAVQAARKLVSVDNVPLIVGEYLSGNTIAIGKYTQSANIVLINPGSSSPEVANIGDHSVSSIGLDNLAGAVAAKNLFDAGYRKIAFLGPNNAYGAEFGRVVKADFEKLGGQSVLSMLYTEGQSDYRTELQRLKGSGADVYVYATYLPDSVVINKEAFQLALDPKKFYGIYLSICVDGVEAKAIAGQQGQDLAYVGPDGQSYEKSYVAEYGFKPKTPYSGYAYDAVMMAAKAINKAGSGDPAKILDALKQIGVNYSGATGTITFDNHGQRVQAPYDLLRVSGSGALDTIQTLVGPGQ